MRPTFQLFAVLVLVAGTIGLTGLWVTKHPLQGHVRESLDNHHTPKPSQKPQSRSALRRQIQALLSTPVPLTLDRAALKLTTEFSCGGTHVVELNSYRDLKATSKLKELLPRIDLFIGSRSKRLFKSCAVVGNSGSLLETQYGDEIDKHDVVIRFNHGVTENYEQFVGSRTSFRIYNGPVSEPKQPGEVTISTVRDRGIKKWAADVLLHKQRNETAYVFDPEFLCYSWQWVRNQGHKPSSGLVGMIFALKICNKVLAYGFQSKNYFSSTSRPHYYDWERPAKGREKVHPFQREMTLYKQLEELGFLRFRHSD